MPRQSKVFARDSVSVSDALFTCLSSFVRFRVYPSRLPIIAFLCWWAALPIFVQSLGHTWSGLVVVWIFVGPPPFTSPSADRKYSFEYFHYKKVNFMHPVRESDKLRFASTLQESSMRRSLKISSFTWVDLVTWMFWGGATNVSSFGTSRFHVMTTDEVTFHRPKVSPEFNVILWILSVQTLVVRLEFLRWDLRSLQVVTAFEWLLQIRGLYLTTLLYHLLLRIWTHQPQYVPSEFTLRPPAKKCTSGENNR